MLKWKVASKPTLGESSDGGASTTSAATVSIAPNIVQDLQRCLQAAATDLSRIDDRGHSLLATLGASQLLPPEQQDQAKDVVTTVLGLKSQFEMIQSQVMQLIEIQQQHQQLRQAVSFTGQKQSRGLEAIGCARESCVHDGSSNSSGGGGGVGVGGGSASPDVNAFAAGAKGQVRRCRSCQSRSGGDDDMDAVGGRSNGFNGTVDGIVDPAASCPGESPPAATCRANRGHLERQGNLESPSSPRVRPLPRWHSASPVLSRLAKAEAATSVGREMMCRQQADTSSCGFSRHQAAVLVREASSSSSREGADDWDPMRSCHASSGLCNGSGAGVCSAGALQTVADSDDQSSMTSGWSDSSKETQNTASETRHFLVHDKSLSAPNARRIRVINDFMESERKYCTVLSAVVKDYMEAPQPHQDVSDRDAKIIFPSSLKNIYKFHRKLLSLLERRSNMGKELVDVMGDVFSRFTESVDELSVFSEYKDYVDNFPAALSTIRRLQKCSSEFRKWVKRCRRSSVLVLDLTNLLLIPVCRVPGYVATLQQLLQLTEPEHPDAFHLRWCLPKFEAVAGDLSQAIAKSVTMAKFRLSDEGGIADDSTIEEESSARRTGSEDSVLVRCKDGSERTRSEDVVVLSSVAASDSSLVGLLPGSSSMVRSAAVVGRGDDYSATAPPRSYTAQSVLNGLVTLPRKQRKDKETKSAMVPSTSSSLGPAEGHGAVAESNVRNIRVTPQGNSYCVSNSTTLPRLPKRPTDAAASVVAGNGTIHHSSASAADAATAVAIGFASKGISGSPRAIHEKSRLQRSQNHHSSQFDLRHGLQSSAGKSAIQRWMHASQPDLLSTRCSGSLHSLAGGGNVSSVENDRLSGADDGKKQKRKGFGALLKFFFAKKLMQKSKATNGVKKGPVASDGLRGNAGGGNSSGNGGGTLFVQRLRTGGGDLATSNLTLERFQLLPDSTSSRCSPQQQYRFGNGSAKLSDLDQLPELNDAAISLPGGITSAATASPVPERDKLI